MDESIINALTTLKNLLKSIEEVRQTIKTLLIDYIDEEVIDYLLRSKIKILNAPLPHYQNIRIENMKIVELDSENVTIIVEGVVSFATNVAHPYKCKVFADAKTFPKDFYTSDRWFEIDTSTCFSDSKV